MHLPKTIGGKLIRRAVQVFRRHFKYDHQSQKIFIACSGGSDSTALAVLLARYGKSIAPPSSLTLFHVNHGWRGRQSDLDEAFVRRLAKKLGVGFIGTKVTPPNANTESWEEDARNKREKEYLKLVEGSKNTPLILTAHTQDDLAETILWRMCTGTFLKVGAGILEWQPHSRVLRPFLFLSKSDLLGFLKEEKQSFRVDQTNLNARFLRAKMRLEIFPRLEKVFPKAKERLSEIGLKLQELGGISTPTAQDAILEGLRALQVKLRRSNYLEFEKFLASQKAGARQLMLPGGWRLKQAEFEVYTITRVKSKSPGIS